MDHSQWNEAWSRYREFNYVKLAGIYDHIRIDDLPRDANILDLGCGSGEFIKILKERGFTSIDGWEIQSDLIAEAGSDCIREGNCLVIPETPPQYDAIVMLGVLHHLSSFDEVSTALKNVRRMLKPGGTFFSVEPRNSLARAVMTHLMFAIPMGLLPAQVKIDRFLVDQEKVELNRWLAYEHRVADRAGSIGLTCTRMSTDWKCSYRLFQNKLKN